MNTEEANERRIEAAEEPNRIRHHSAGGGPFERDSPAARRSEKPAGRRKMRPPRGNR